ncbi:hypothetical protein CR970_02840 [Candidatus Saccharibacteria bacterium]|nr:MAG: hypothetical protein CR970_02840 [Candidatus Saccharibacteria bacterium]
MTQTFTQKYTIVQFLEGVSDGCVFSSDNWPLHSTVVDTFAVDWSADELVAALTKVLQVHAPAESVAEGDEFFGDAGQTRVVLLQRSESLLRLHIDVLAGLEAGGLVLNDPQFARDGFLPHATVQRHARLRAGDVVRFGALSVVDMFPGGDPYKRVVLKTIDVGADAS